MKKQWKNREGVVYSTNQDFEYDTNEIEETETLSPAKQKLSVFIDRKQRKGKSVTIIAGFIGKSDDLEALSKQIKTKCGTGGSAKNGEIIIQGEMIDKIKEFLLKEGYNLSTK
ncbi:MAG: translation initiation factor [Bacteroidales bacterium]|jgi:translation initiation factor 1|nr:translation initiation factor [Bacteroidales bacterium]MDY0141190.1 translation initiation factor [Bacteroidales bacterium]